METTIFGWSWTTRPRDVKSQFWMMGVGSWLLVPLFWHPCLPPNLALVISHIIICLYIRTYIYIYIYIISMENQPFIDVKTNVLPIFRCTGHHRSFCCVPDVAPWLRSSLYPIMDQLGDLPVNDQVQGAMKATGPTGGRKTPRIWSMILFRASISWDIASRTIQLYIIYIHTYYNYITIQLQNSITIQLYIHL